MTDGEAQKVKIFPSYFTDHLTLELPSTSSGTAFIYDVTGNEAARQDYYNATRVTFDGLDLRAGIYFVMVRTTDGILGTGKVIRK